MAIITSSIGTSSRNYSTIALWEASLPASAVSAGNSYVGECYNDSEFNFGTTKCAIAGTTTDATHTITLKAAAGQGFRDHATAATNALRYNASNGVAIKGAIYGDSLLDVSNDYVTIQNLQLLNTGTFNRGIGVCVSRFTEFDNCILQSTGGFGYSNTIGVICLQFYDFILSNCVLIADTSAAMPGIQTYGNGTILNCTIVKPSNQTAGSSGISDLSGPGANTLVIKNTVIAGFTTAITNAAIIMSGSNNAIDTASYPTGVTGQTSLVIATEFENPSNASSVMDWRLKSTSVKCKDNGTNTGTPSTDIIGQAIYNTTRDVGAWEFVVAGPSVITKSIGTASRDYSTIALWEAALPASAVTAGNSYVGECYNDTEFDLSTTLLVFAGTTTDATHTITLKTAAGQGFKNNGSAASNALRYNASNGVAIKAAVPYQECVTVTDSYVTFQNLQIKNTAGGNSHGVYATGSNFTADGCIIQNAPTGANGNPLKVVAGTALVQNCLLVCDTSAANAGFQFATSGSVINCTIVRPTNQTTGGTGIVIPYSGTNVIQNCVIAGFTTAMSLAGSVSGSGNAIEAGSYPGSITGQVSLTIATEFENPSNASGLMDWRLKSTSVKCKDLGTNSGAPTTDIIGQAISNTTRDVGAWELQGGVGPTFLAAWAMDSNPPVLGTGNF